MKTKLILALFLLLNLSACADSPRIYHLWAGARAEKYEEKESVPIDQAIANSIGGTVRATSGDPNKISVLGVGGQLGMIEDIDHLRTVLSIYYLQYPQVDYSFQTSAHGAIQESLKVSEIGLDGMFGYHIGAFTPGFGYKYASVLYRGTVSGGSPVVSQSINASSRLLAAGPSLVFDLPVIGWFHLVAEGDYRFLLNKASTISSASWLSLQVGVRVLEWDSEPNKKN